MAFLMALIEIIDLLVTSNVSKYKDETVPPFEKGNFWKMKWNVRHYVKKHPVFKMESLSAGRLRFLYLISFITLFS